MTTDAELRRAAEALIDDHKKYGMWRLPRRFKALEIALAARSEPPTLPPPDLALMDVLGERVDPGRPVQVVPGYINTAGGQYDIPIARSEPRAEGLREPLPGQVAVLARVIDGTEGQVPAGWTLVGIAEPGAATPPAEGLDVERLAEAMHRSRCDRPPGYSTHAVGNGVRCQLAADVAREYVALAPEQPE